MTAPYIPDDAQNKLMALLRGMSSRQPRQPITTTAPQPDPFTRIKARTALGMDDTSQRPSAEQMLAAAIVGGGHDVAMTIPDMAQETAHHLNNAYGNARFGNAGDVAKSLGLAGLAALPAFGFPESSAAEGMFSKINPLIPESAEMIYGGMIPKRGLQEQTPGLGDALLSATHEQTPAATSGHNAGVMGSPIAEEYARRGTWKDENGRDIMYAMARGGANPANLQTISNRGVYTNPATGMLETNPGEVARTLVPTQFDKASQGHLVSPYYKDLIDAAETLRGAIDAQAAGGYNVTGLRGSTTHSPIKALGMPTTGAISGPQVAKLEGLLSGRGVLDNGNQLLFPDWGGTNSSSLASMKQQLPVYKADVARVTGMDASQLKPMRVQGNLIEQPNLYDAAHAGSGDVTRNLIDIVNNEPAYGELFNDRTIAKKANRNYKRNQWAEQMGYGQARPDIQNFLREFSKGGLKGVEAALNQGVPMPAILAALGLSGAATQNQSDKKP